MGLFDSLFKDKIREVANSMVGAVADAVSDALSEVVDGNTSSGTMESKVKNTVTRTTVTAVEEDDRSFDEKFREVIGKMGTYEIRTNIHPDELEQETGVQIYTRSGCYAEPNELSYVLYKDGQRVLIVNLWWVYEDYKHAANRQIRSFCDKRGIKVLDFFDYLPNEVDYMEERIRAALV